MNPGAGSDVQAVRDFSIAVNANYEKAHYKDFVGCFIFTNITGQVNCGTINGVQLARLPNFQIRVTPQDIQTFNWGTLTEFVAYEHIGQHFQDNTGLNPLGSYYDLGAGIVADIGDQLAAASSRLKPDQSVWFDRGQRPRGRERRAEQCWFRTVDRWPRGQH